MRSAKKRVPPENVLVALDDSEGAWRAVDYAGRRFGRSTRVRITLLHVLPDLPPEFWDIGHFLTRGEKRARERTIQEWERAQEKKWIDLVRKARAYLVRSGISATAVRRKFVPGVGDAATEIVDEARRGRFSTIIIGRGGEGQRPSSALGGNADRVVRLAWDLDVIIAGAAPTSPARSGT